MEDARNRLAGINLNLFAVLDALLRRRSATLAAVELGVTASAISHSLRELRGLLDDPLFVRSAGGLAPTVRAQSLEPCVRAAMEALGNAVTFSPTFDPSTSTRLFTIATSDDIGPTLIPRFMARVLSQAPQLTIDIRPRGQRALDMLEAGTTDLAIHVEGSYPSWVGCERLYSDGLSCVVRKGHPKVGKRLTRSLYAKLPHIRIAPDGFGRSTVDLLLANEGVQRHVAVFVPTFAMAPEIAATTDAVLTMPTRLAQLAARRLDLQVFAPPVSVPDFTVNVLWSTGRDDEGLAWVRQQLHLAAAD